MVSDKEMEERIMRKARGLPAIKRKRRGFLDFDI